MLIQASTILSFVSGRLYADQAPTVLFSDITTALIGRQAFTHELPSIADAYRQRVIDQLPEPFAKICQNWQHSDDWRIRVQSLDHTFGQIDIHA